VIELYAEYSPFLANIRGEPRFKELMKQVRYECGTAGMPEGLRKFLSASISMN